MPTIKNVLNEYHGKIDALDLELLIASSINKPREFVLTHPEYRMNSLKIENLKLKISHRLRGKPLAYILGKKEFFGLDFKVNENVLIPRPETELMVEEVLRLDPRNYSIIDVGTGSGNIIISLAKTLKGKNELIAIDISKGALSVAKQNAKKHKVAEKIKFIESNFLDGLIGNRHRPGGAQSWREKLKIENSKVLILANLPYLSKSIYSQVSREIKRYEPGSALLSGKHGLAHYESLLRQIKKIKKSYPTLYVSCFLEISPEQKSRFERLVKNLLTEVKITFYRDLARRWRICRIDL